MCRSIKVALYRRFGSTYGSKDLMQVRKDLLERIRWKYGTELQHGATREEAIEAALPSPEEIEAIRAPYVREGMAKGYYRGICITLILSAIPMLFSAWVCCQAAARTGDASAWRYFWWTIPCVLLITAGALLLQCTGRKVVPVLCILVGAPALMINLYIVLMIQAGNISERNPKYFDYTDRINSVESIELVRLDGFVRESSEGECLEYTIIEPLDPKQYAPILQDLAALRYVRWTNDPSTLFKGNTLILIRFVPGQGNPGSVYYWINKAGYVQQEGTMQRLEQEYYHCDSDAWKTLISKYFPDAPLG